MYESEADATTEEKIIITVEPRYNEVSRYRKNIRYSGVFVIAKTPL